MLIYKQIIILRFLTPVLIFLITPSLKANDTVKLYIGGVSSFNRFYILNNVNFEKIKVGKNLAEKEIIIVDSLDLKNYRFYYKYGLFNRRREIKVIYSNEKNLLFYFGRTGFNKGICRYRWDEKRMYIE